MRMAQFHGLPQEAENFLNDQAKQITDTLCPSCGYVLTKRRVFKKIGETYGMDDTETFPLNEYYLKDGRVVREELQATIWSSGPMIFYRLVEMSGEEDEHGHYTAFFPPLYEWDPNEMEMK